MGERKSQGDHSSSHAFEYFLSRIYVMLAEDNQIYKCLRFETLS